MRVCVCGHVFVLRFSKLLLIHLLHLQMGVLLGLLGIIAFVIICVYACCCGKKRGYYSLAERKGNYTRKAAIVCCIIIS